MEKELFLSGYCRQLDAARMVEVIIEGSQVTEVDCCYPDCPHAPNCTVAESIREQISPT